MCLDFVDPVGRLPYPDEWKGDLHFRLPVHGTPQHRLQGVESTGIPFAFSLSLSVASISLYLPLTVSLSISLSLSLFSHSLSLSISLLSLSISLSPSLSLSLRLSLSRSRSISVSLSAFFLPSFFLILINYFFFSALNFALFYG